MTKSKFINMLVQDGDSSIHIKLLKISGKKIKKENDNIKTDLNKNNN